MPGFDDPSEPRVGRSHKYQVKYSYCDLGTFLPIGELGQDPRYRDYFMDAVHQAGVERDLLAFERLAEFAVRRGNLPELKSMWGHFRDGLGRSAGLRHAPASSGGV